jgi:hypothetical protein
LLDPGAGPSHIVPVTRSANIHPEGHVLIPTGAIGGLSILLAGGLAALGVIARVNSSLAMVVSREGRQTFPKHLPEWSIWLATVFFAFALAFAILSTPGHWRRLLLWLSSVVLMGAWAPVLSLAAHSPDIAAPWVATVWAGVCAVIYAANHRMACDEPSNPNP